MNIFNLLMLVEARAPTLSTKYNNKIVQRSLQDRTVNINTGEELEFVERLEAKFGAYVEWVLNLWLKGDISGDMFDSVSQTLNLFNQHKSGMQIRDINQYKTFASLNDAVNNASTPSSNRQQKREAKEEGIRKLFDNSSYMIAELLTKEAAILYGKNTKWCTTATSDSGETNEFDEYKKQGPLYIVIDKAANVKYQIHYQAMQFMDETNHAVSHSMLLSKYPELQKIADQHKPTVEQLSSRPDRMVAYAERVLEGRWPEAERFLLQHQCIRELVQYAMDVLKRRWPEAESIILTKGNSIWNAIYATMVIRDVWPEAEPTILKDGMAIIQYAVRSVKGRWPKGEKSLLKKPDYITEYAKQVIGDRWPEGEQVLLKKNAHYALQVYARDVIKGPWPEAGITK